MITDWAATYNTGSTSNPADVHICNCIGCCKVCGMCRTSLKHTPDKCAKVAELRSQIKEVLND